mgnify:FL=1
MESVYIDKVLSGDVEAFTYFVKTYKNMAFTVSLSIVKDEQYAEEVTQDAFMKAFNGLKSFNRTAKFKSWFYRIVVNESFLRLRTLKKSKPIVPIEEQNDAILEEQFEEITENHSARISKVLSLMPPKEALALELFYLQEMSINDITIVTEWTKTNTKVILHRARKNIRLLWKKTT